MHSGDSAYCIFCQLHRNYTCIGVKQQPKLLCELYRNLFCESNQKSSSDCSICVLSSDVYNKIEREMEMGMGMGYSSYFYVLWRANKL